MTDLHPVERGWQSLTVLHTLLPNAAFSTRTILAYQALDARPRDLRYAYAGPILTKSLAAIAIRAIFILAVCYADLGLITLNTQ